MAVPSLQAAVDAHTMSRSVIQLCLRRERLINDQPVHLFAAFTTLQFLLPATTSMFSFVHQLHPTKQRALRNHLQPPPLTPTRNPHVSLSEEAPGGSVQRQKFACKKLA